MNPRYGRSIVPITGDIELMSAFHALGELLTDDLPEVATQALIEGKDSPSLRRLAGSTSQNAFELKELFERSLIELELSVPDETIARRALAKNLATAIVDGTLDPILGAKHIWRAFIPDYPDEVIGFLQLEDEYDSDIDRRPEISLEIVEEAKRYLAESS